jgi:hypothetical protein
MMQTLTETTVRVSCWSGAPLPDVVGLALWLAEFVDGYRGVRVLHDPRAVLVATVAADPVAAVQDALRDCPHRCFESVEVR